MVVILYQDGCQDVAEKTAAELIKTFADYVTVLLLTSEFDSAWPAESSWDDLLIVVFNDKSFPAAGNRFIADYLQKRPDTSLLLPVALKAASRKPPEAAAAIKALQYDVAASCSFAAFSRLSIGRPGN
jgi:hypothetical protein